MRKIILQLAVSLDGYIEGPNGEYDWCFTDQDYGMTSFFQRIDSVFYGRKSYELVASMGDAEAAMSGFPKLTEYVFSTTLKDAKPGVIVINENAEAAVRKIKEAPGKDIWLFGGAGLTASLFEMKMIDEIRLAVHPILLGSGKPLFFESPKRIQLKMEDSKTYSSGLVMLHYSLAV